MSYVNSTQVVSTKVNTQQVKIPVVAHYYQENPIRSLQDEFVCQHKKNGLFERLYNSLKNLTGLGVGSKKVQKAIDEANRGNADSQEVNKLINKYRKSQASSEQTFGDVLSVGASGITFFSVLNLLKKQTAEAVLNEKYYANIKGKGNLSKTFNEWLLKVGKSKSKVTLLAAGAAAFAGALTKFWGLKFNRIGSDEFKCNKKDFNGAKSKLDKTVYKKEKKKINKARRRANFRNFVSGALNGLMMPITMIGGAFVGIPAYFAGNSLNRYFIGNHEEKDKNFKGNKLVLLLFHIV